MQRRYTSRHRRFIPAHAGNTASPGIIKTAEPVHPRACGEHQQIDAYDPNRYGSSPRMRGTHRRDVLHERVFAVHPRACGEHTPSSNCRWCLLGSSPRMRGTPPIFPPLSRLTRFIPAHAGNTTRAAVNPKMDSVHPRACGEHRSQGSSILPVHGSSPRMRGTRPVYVGACLLSRFIPAHAGNTGIRACTRLVAPVHPRACGEHKPGPRTRSIWSGSSPRMRGTQVTKVETGKIGRFIPAHAGNTIKTQGAAKGAAVHPRACGEHGEHLRDAELGLGSSPRMRGTRLPHFSASIPGRFIPAHAGNTRACGSGSSRAPVHPRACGEHSSGATDNLGITGSSPRMRGTQLGPERKHQLKRFIPAHAGNTCSKSSAPS